MPELLQIPAAQLIEPPEPVRASMDDTKLSELAQSIREMGILQPLIVVSDGVLPNAEVRALAAADTQQPADGLPRYRIVAGHRRFMAARAARLKELPCWVFEPGDLAEQAVMLHENIYREDLSAAEEGWFYLELVEKLHLSEQQLVDMVHQSKEYIYARIDLVQGDAELAKANAERKLSLSVARSLMRCKDESHRRYLMDLAIESGASQRVVEGWIAQWRQVELAKQSSAPLEQCHEPTLQPAGPLYKCFLCGRGEDPQNMVTVYLHRYEVAHMRKLFESLDLTFHMVEES